MDRLPLEMLQKVASYLCSDDLATLRQTNKAFSTAVAPTLFRTLCPSLAKDSLEELVNVFRRGTLKNCVRTLAFGTHQCTANDRKQFLHAIWREKHSVPVPAGLTPDNKAKFAPLQCRRFQNHRLLHGAPSSIYNILEVVDAQSFEVAYSKHLELARFADDLEPAVALLVQALTMFPSLVRVTINNETPCGGVERVNRYTLGDYKFDSASIKENTTKENKILVVIGRALAASERKLKILEFDADEFSMSICQLYGFCEALGEKSGLVLQDLECLTIRYVYDDERDDRISGKYWNSLNHLTKFTPLLTELSFSASFDRRGRFTPTMDLPFPKLCYLRTLDITNMEFHQSFLLRMLQAYSGTIRHLDLAFNLITDGSWALIFDQLHSRFSLESLNFDENEERNQDLGREMGWEKMLAGFREVSDIRNYDPDETDYPSLLEFLNGQSTVNPIRRKVEEAKARKKEQRGSKSD